MTDETPKAPAPKKPVATKPAGAVPKKDHAVFTFGRFSPPTTGHKKLVDAVVNHARIHKADHFVFASHTHDSIRNPLSHKEKTGFMRKFFPNANVHSGEGVHTAIDAVKHLHKSGYKKVTMVVGSDRQKEFHNLLHKYNHTAEYDIPHLTVRSAGHRDPDAEGVEGMSASKMRDAVQKRDFTSFRKGVPVRKHAKDLYRAVRRGMRLENIQRQFKAIFLVGAPGSGKDFILSSILDESKLAELPLDKFVKAAQNGTDLSELNNHQSIIINGSAESIGSVTVAKKILETMNYETLMIYVYTTDEESKSRNDERIANGSKTITEEVRASKYSKCQHNMKLYAEYFDKFYLFDNSRDYETVSEQDKAQITLWLEELGSSVGEFLTEAKAPKLNLGPKVPTQLPAPSAPHDVPAGYERVKDGKFNVLRKKRDVNEAFEELFGEENGANPAAEHSVNDDADNETNGIVINGKKNKLPMKTVKEAEIIPTTSIIPKAEKRKNTRSALPPSAYGDQKIGTVPSGMGVMATHVGEGKSFQSIRKGTIKLESKDESK